MKVKTISASRQVHVELGNRESQTLWVSMTAELDDLDAELGCLAVLDRQVEKAVYLRLLELHKSRGKIVPEADLTKRYGVRP